MFSLIPISNAYAKGSYNIKIPHTFAYNGYLPNGKSIYDFDNNSYENIQPLMILAKEYVGNLNTSFTGYNYTYEYIYGTTVIFYRGASPSYTLTTDVQRTCGTAFKVSSSLTADAEIIKSTVSSSFTSTETITLRRGETWSCGFTEPGTYNLTWYISFVIYI